MASFSDEDLRTLFGMGLTFEARRSLAVEQNTRAAASTFFVSLCTEIEKQVLELERMEKEQVQSRVKRYKRAIERLLDGLSELTVALLELEDTEHSRKEELFVLLLNVSPKSMDSLKDHRMLRILPALLRDVVPVLKIDAAVHSKFMGWIKSACDDERNICASRVKKFISQKSPVNESRTGFENFNSPGSGAQHHATQVTRMQLAIVERTHSRLSLGEASKLEFALSHMFPKGIMESSQRQHEGESRRSDCLAALVPKGRNADFSFIITVGNAAGWNIVTFLGLEDTPVIID